MAEPLADETLAAIRADHENGSFGFGDGEIGVLLDEVDRLRAHVDELEAFLPPTCAHCGERNPDGSHNEHDATWMCAPCHTTAARGEMR